MKLFILNHQTRQNVTAIPERLSQFTELARNGRIMLHNTLDFRLVQSNV